MTADSQPNTPELVDAVDQDVYSSVIIGDGACGGAYLFSTGLGMECPSVGVKGAAQENSEALTNMRESGRLGSMGDGIITGVSARILAPRLESLVLAELFEKTSVSIEVAAREYFSTTLQSIHSETPSREVRALDLPIHVGRADNIAAIVRFSSPLKLAAPVRLTIFYRMMLGRFTSGSPGLPPAKPRPHPFEQIARAAHEINRAYCQSIGDDSQPPWESAHEHQRSSAVDAVTLRLANLDAPPSASHESYQKSKDYLFIAVVKTMAQMFAEQFS